MLQQQQQEISQGMIDDAWSDISNSQNNSNSFSSTEWFHHLRRFQQLKGTPDRSKSTPKKPTPIQLKSEQLQRLDSKLVVYLAKTLLSCGVHSDELAVITPFNSEKNHLYSKLSVILT